VVVEVPLGGADRVLRDVSRRRPESVWWASVDSTRRSADLERWLRRLPGPAALVALNCESSCAPAELLATGLPVALLDGRPALPRRWASLLCEQLAEDPW
jgi:hypothetical protein